MDNKIDAIIQRMKNKPLPMDKKITYLCKSCNDAIIQQMRNIPLPIGFIINFNDGYGHSIGVRNTMKNITKDNNKFIYTDDKDELFIISIPTGVYDFEMLFKTIQKLMTENDHENVVKFSINMNTFCSTIDIIKPGFKVIFNNLTFGSMLGFLGEWVLEKGVNISKNIVDIGI